MYRNGERSKKVSICIANELYMGKLRRRKSDVYMDVPSRLIGEDSVEPLARARCR